MQPGAKEVKIFVCKVSSCLKLVHRNDARDEIQFYKMLTLNPEFIETIPGVEPNSAVSAE